MGERIFEEIMANGFPNVQKKKKTPINELRINYSINGVGKNSLTLHTA